MKSDGREYLLEYVLDQSDWLKALIYEAIDSNGDIRSEKMEYILDALLYDSKIDIVDCNPEVRNTSNKIILTKLHHKQGVNALANDQVIKFCDEVNILYGMNGTGKSSYFRILNEIVGGYQRKEILSNINEDVANEIKVDVSYKDSDKLEEIVDWDAKSRSISGINKCMVYDTSYQESLLNIRESNVTLVEPLGLHLFSYLIETLDNMKDKVNLKVERLDAEKPYINTENLSQRIKDVFISGTFTKEFRDSIIQKGIFNKDEVESLKQIEEEIQLLKQIDTKDKIELLNGKIRSLEILIASIVSKHDKLKDKIDSVRILVSTYVEKRRLNKKAQESYQVLKSIPKSDTYEWKEFIKAGVKYSNILQESEKDICPYCRQYMQAKESVEITAAFSLYLKDKTQLEYDEITEKITITFNEIKDMITDVSVQENIKSILREHAIGNETILDRIKALSVSFSMIKARLLSTLESRKLVETTEIIESPQVISKLTDIKGAIDNQISDYLREDETKKNKIDELVGKQKILEEKKSICLQKELIQKWFSVSDEIERLNSKKPNISSRPLSLISKKAHEELLTDSLRDNFAEELNKIGVSHLDVELQGGRVRKGTSSTRLVIKNLEDVQMILSEGEQRAVALALFIAEIRLQKNINPIILDDPVNSLDHKIAGGFAERLLELENQVILFAHNRLFLDAFESSKTNHVCRTIDSDCNKTLGKHIRIYEVISHSKNQKGVLRRYKGSKLKDKINEIEKLLKIFPFEEDVKTANLIRLAVESTIDEVIFNHQVPTRFSNKNSRIQWDALKGLNKDDNVIETLKAIHSRLSGGSMHNGNEKIENPIDLEEYKEFVSKIKDLAGL